MKKQPITKEMVMEATHACYENICFSTFPYLLYKVANSKQALDMYNSGNCIGLCTFIKTYLFNNFGVRSYIIPATVPTVFQVEGTPAICHVALLIPETTQSFFIVDPAFYFIEPIHCILNDPSMKTMKSMNIHEKTVEPIQYRAIHSTNNAVLADIYETVCFFKRDDPWSYYANEVLDPDESIGCHFIRCKPQPFLCKTEMDVDKVKVKKIYHLKIDEDGYIIVIKNHEEVYKGPLDKIPPSIENEIHTKLFKYFNNYLT
jgi:hypothetical protein